MPESQDAPIPAGDAALRRALRAHPGRTAAVVGLLALAGAAEGLGVVVLVPLLDGLIGGGKPSGVSRAMTSLLAWAGLHPGIGALLLAVVLALALKAVFRWLAMAQVGGVVAGVAAELRASLLRGLLRARWTHVADLPAGALAGALGRDAFWAAFAYRDACAALAAAIQLGVYAVAALLVSWKLGLLALLAAAVASAPLRVWVRASRRAGGLQTRHTSTLLSRALDVMQALKPIKAMGREAPFLAGLEAETRSLRAAERQHVRATEALQALQEPLLAGVVALTIYLAVWRGGESAAALVVVAVLFQRMIARAQSVQSELQALAAASSAFESMQARIDDAEHFREAADSSLPAPTLRHALELDRVRFRHGGREVLRDVSLLVPAGAFVAITGRSGAGKTTLLDIVAGLRQPDAGQLRIDGRPLAELSVSAWRGMIGYVPQDSALLHDTIAANVCMGDDVAAADIAAALAAAGAAELVARLPMGSATVVGERASRLSGGERRRIALARALAAHPSVLLLDEATAELDAPAAAAIGRTLRTLRGALTIIAVTHHAELAAAADIVYALEDGALRRPEPARARA